MENLTKLLFEMASSERMNIMLELKEKDLKLTQLARTLNLTATETSRHLQRLNDAKLIQKTSEGLYRLSQFGNITLMLMRNLAFVSTNKNYFEEYDPSGIPEEFIGRLGELSEGTFSAETFKNLESGEQWIKEAQEFVWIMSDSVLSNTIPILMQKISKPFDLRIILPEGKFPPENVSRLPKTNTSIQKRVLDKVEILVVMTEKHAVFCLPNKSGRMDYQGFIGEDKRFRNWCKELFLYYWNKSQPITPK